MRFLVTGGAGFIGSALVERLVAEGAELVVSFDKLTYAALPQTVAHLHELPRHRLIVGDVTDAAALEAAFRAADPDAVLHLAAESHVDRSIDGPMAFVETNVVGSTRLLEASLAHWRRLPSARREGYRHLQVSTDEVFGSLDFDAAPFTADSALAPRSPYAASKAAADHLLLAWKETYGLPVLLSHCSNNYGPRQHPEKLIPTVIGKALAGQAIPVYGKGANVRDWLHVEDHVEGLLAFLRRGRSGQRMLFGGHGGEIGNLELVERLCDLLDASRPGSAPHRRLIQFVEDRPGHDLRYAVDPKEAERSLGWRPRIDLDEGLAATLAWYLENPGWTAGSGHDGRRLGLDTSARKRA